jgi:fructokinase
VTEKPENAVFCFGEVLWDCLPAGLFMGGAPFNVSCHLRQFGRAVIPVSAVGHDFLGDEILRRIRLAGIDGRFVSRVDAPTGVVLVELDERGKPSYEIVRDVAWDRIPGDSELIEAAGGATALVYGSLAQRSPGNRRILGELLASSAGLKVFDVNLRSPFDDLALVRELLTLADLIKLNDEEIQILVGEHEEIEHAAILLSERAGGRNVCVTAGARGAGLLWNGRWHWCEGRRIKVRDTVGAGDSFMAALLDGVLREAPLDAVLRRACRLAEFVASSDGATPDHAGAPCEALEI